MLIENQTSGEEEMTREEVVKKIIKMNRIICHSNDEDECNRMADEQSELAEKYGIADDEWELKMR